MQLRRSLLFLLGLLGGLLFQGRAHAQDAPLYVVDVKGDRFQAAHARAAIGRELGADTIAPDDARAGAAAGVITLEANTADRSLVVRFQKHAAPVERSTRLPEDPARAETTAVYLAGNLARDDAKALLDALTPPPAKAVKAEQEATKAHDDEALRVLRVRLETKAEDDVRQWRAAIGGSLVAGALAIGGGAYVAAEANSAGAKATGNMLGGAGSAALGSGLAMLLNGNPDLALVREKLEKSIQAGGSSTEILERVDHDWAAESKRARTGRFVLAALDFIASAGVLAAGTIIELRASSTSDPSTPALFIGAGAVAAGAGVYRIAFESSTESEYRAWKKERAVNDTTARLDPRFGLAPIRGGAAATFGFSF